jgi:hypothetical protein
MRRETGSAGKKALQILLKSARAAQRVKKRRGLEKQGGRWYYFFHNENI